MQFSAPRKHGARLCLSYQAAYAETMDMTRNILPVLALLVGTLFLFLGNGLQGLLLPMRGTNEGYTTTVLGLLGTSWAAGFVLGCLLAPQVVRRVGHVRAFSGFISVLAINALVTGILVDDIWWVALRAITGFATAGTSMIIESWLNERATNKSRGMIFSLYIGITLIGSVGGQLVVPFADVMTPILFMVCGIFYCVAMLPTTLSTAASPQPLNTVKLDLPALFRNSPVSFMGILLVGIANGAFGTLGPVFGAAAGFEQGTIAVMMSVAIMSGALMQLPAGRMSDRMDRRYVLAGLSGVAALSRVAAGAGRHLRRSRQCAVSDRRRPCQRFRLAGGFRQGFRRSAVALRRRHHHRPDAGRPDHVGLRSLCPVRRNGHGPYPDHRLCHHPQPTARPRARQRPRRLHHDRPDGDA